MVEIGGHPRPWHVVKIYASFNIRDFLVALGYRQDVIVRWMIATATPERPLASCGVQPLPRKLATLTAVRPPARFGHLELDGPAGDLDPRGPERATWRRTSAV